MQRSRVAAFLLEGLSVAAPPCWVFFRSKDCPRAALPRCGISRRRSALARLCRVAVLSAKKRPPGANTFCARRKYWMKDAPKGTLYEPSPLETPPNARGFKGLGLRRLGSASAALPGRVRVRTGFHNIAALCRTSFVTASPRHLPQRGRFWHGGNLQISAFVGADAHIGPHARPIPPLSLRGALATWQSVLLL
jgi:hypothetical protein